MEKTAAKLTVFFEDPFWVGVFERLWEGKLTVCKVTFGAEPRDCEVYDFILRHYAGLNFSPAVTADWKETPRNPKRARRERRKETIGTKSQQALQLQREQLHTQRKADRKERRDFEKDRRFQQKQEKRKEKHKGR